MSFSAAGSLSKDAVNGLSGVKKATGIFGVILSGVLAVNDIIKNGPFFNNITSLVLGAAALACIFELGPFTEGVGLLVDAATITNDVISDVKENNNE